MQNQVPTHVIFKDETKIKSFSQIQRFLKELGPRSNDSEIENFISLIPNDLLNQKDDLQMICQIIAFYARNNVIPKKSNAIKIFRKLMDPIKLYLQDESSYSWSIFGGNFYLKLMFYEEGLISLDTIILSAQSNITSLETEYFLPEIMDNDPEFFEKEMKHEYKLPYSKDYIDQFKKLRKKHFEWILNSSDFNDPVYREIEKNPLRLAVKTDDVNSFQKILSNMNLSFNSKIQESAVDNFLLYSNEISLIKYAIQYNSIQICKFLMMNDAAIEDNTIHFAIYNENYDLIKLIESKKIQSFAKQSFLGAIYLRNEEMIEYIMTNYDDFCFLEKGKSDNEFECEENSEKSSENDENDRNDKPPIKQEKSSQNDEKNSEINENSDRCLEAHYESVMEIFKETVSSVNFIFFETILLPFFRRNPKLVRDNIYEIIVITFTDKSCFFLSEFLNYPGIDVNYHMKSDNQTFLSQSILDQNTKAVEILLNRPDIRVNEECYEKHSAFQCACAINSDMKIIKLFCKKPGFDINFEDPDCNESAFQIMAQSGFYKAAQYVVDNFPDLKFGDFILLFFFAISNNHFLMLKYLVKFYLMKNKNFDESKLTSEFKKRFKFIEGYNENFVVILHNIIHEVIEII